MRSRDQPITYGSVCSGIEAASVAWEPLGFTPRWFSQFDPEHNYRNGPDFPSAVLAHRWPHVPNLGDMTKIAAGVRAGSIPAPYILVGGTPCQAFSIAGLRGGIADPRGALTLAYVDLFNAIDESRIATGDDPAVCVWENVPGVLTSKDNAFGCFLAGLAGEDDPLQPPGKKWTNAGYVHGPQRAVAWRVLDAQYFGVAQRRRRVFVVASADPNVDPAQILFESHGVRRDSPPSREKGKAVAALTANGVGVRGADDNQGQAGHLIAMAHGQGGAEIKDDGSAPTLTCNHEAPIIFSSNGHASFAEGVNPLRAKPGSDHETLAVCVSGEPYTLAIRGRGDEIRLETRQDGTANALLTPNGGRGGIGVGAISWGLQVRRLLPVECERLQGFPDGHTQIPYRKKPDSVCPDGPRYKACGNSMAVPVMRWIGLRIIFQRVCL